MPTYSTLRTGQRKEARAAAATVRLDPEDFADGWSARPKDAVMIGLRRLSELEEQGATVEAHSRAIRLIPDHLRATGRETYVELYNESLMGIVIARAMCDPNDVAKPSGIFPAAEDQIFTGLRRYTITRLFETLEREVVETSPIYREADDGELQELRDALAADSGAWDVLPAEVESRVRRFAAFMLDDMRAT